MDKKWFILIGLVSAALLAKLLLPDSADASADRDPGAGPATPAQAPSGATLPPVQISEPERQILTEAHRARMEKKAHPNSQTLKSLQPLIHKARKAPNDSIRAAAINGLASVGHPSRPVIETLLDGMDDPSPQVRARAMSALRRLSGRSFRDYRPDGPEAERRKAIRRIRKVFEKTTQDQKDA